MRNFIIIISVICLTVIISGTLSASIQIHPKSSQESSIQIKTNELIEVIRELETVTISDEIWSNILKYIQKKDIQGLLGYLEKLPETQLALEWLEKHYSSLFLGICWIFDACTVQDVVIDPAIIQKILRLIAANDWDGLIEYLKKMDEFYALADWIKSNFPDAWQNICQSIELPC